MKTPMKLYVGAPYTHPEEAVRLARVKMATKIAAHLMSLGYVVFSPLTHSDPIADYLPNNFRMNHDFWMAQDLPFLEMCDMLVICEMDGWTKSAGLNEEIQFCASRNITMNLIDINTYEMKPFDAGMERIIEIQDCMPHHETRN